MRYPKNSHFTLKALVVLIPVAIALSCSNQNEPKKFTIGFSQCIGGTWRESMLEEMKRELAFHPNIKLLYRQADGNTQTQVQQVRELLNQHVDLLIVSPNEAQPLTPIVGEAFTKGIPVIVVDRKIASPLYTTYVGGDNYEVGRQAGEYAGHLLKTGGNVLEFTLPPGSSNAAERHQGFVDAIKAYPNIHLIESINGEILKGNIKDPLLTKAVNRNNIDLVFAQNDFLASRAADLFANRPKPKIIGADGLASKGEGMDLVSTRKITATMLYPTGGEEAIRTAVKILDKKDFSREYNLQTTVIDSTNVRYLRLQADKLRSQQNSIERQQSMLSELETIYVHLKTVLVILVILLLLSIVFGVVALYSLRENRKINKKLQFQNDEILRQKQELEIMSAKAQEANEAKVAFFTNISHEFRTPLTLILGPLDDLLSNTRNLPAQKQNLTLIHKNVNRLLRLVNQLMDFRKIEVDKMRLKISENDLVSFLREIMLPYQNIAQKRSIDFRLITTEREIKAWFDMNMLDKVFFNLLYNAFKFTNENGYIHIYVGRSPENNYAILKVEDNGMGMTENAVKHAFEIFNQGDYENQKGSGLGLALSKQIIDLYKGSITLQSEKGKGSVFEIHLLLGKSHFENDDFSENASAPYVFYHDDKIYTADLEQAETLNDPNREVKQEKEYSILIIEDNSDLRRFLKNRLSSEYTIIEAEDGQTALQQAYDNIPDLIISDIIIPVKDGITLVNIFKNDLRTSHIPIIILSGKATIENQIEGMKSMADVYITKPFDIEFLEQTIKSLISNRSKLKHHFTSELPASLKTQTVGKIDRKFISEFTALVESNLANENFTVEDITKALGISRIQLYRKVKALLNVNVNEYILNSRLQRAKYMLQHEDATISEIAYATGFSSPTYFSTVFKSKFGVTPKAFKEK